VRFLLAFILIPFIFQGCLPVFGAGPAGQEIAAGTVLFADDFSDPPGSWGTWNRSGALIDYRDGGLAIWVNETHYDFWSVAGQDFTDVQIEVDAALLSGPVDNDYGIICRYQDRNNFYVLVISSDGYYGVAKLKNGQYSMIGSDQLQYSDLIAQGQALTRLRADCVGDVLSLYVNGRKLTEVKDADFTGGDVGLVAGSYDVAGVHILFDNFVVKKPDLEPLR